MLFRLILLFTVVPLVELYLLLWLGRETSLEFTLALVVVTGLLGAWLSRRQGWRALNRIRADLAAGRLPGDALLDGFMILVAGALLVTPGLLTDIVGFALLIPAGRTVLKTLLRRRFQAQFVTREFSGEAWPHDRPRDVIIDARVVEAPPPSGQEDDFSKGGGS